MKRLLAILGIVATVAGITGPAVAATAPVSHSVHLTMAQRVSLAWKYAREMQAGKVKPADLPIGSATIYTKNGANLCVGAQVFSPGHPVLQRALGNCAPMYDTITGHDVNGFPKYYWEFGPAGYYMAATNDCTKVTIKQDAVSNGVVWILWIDSTGTILKLFPQFCNSSGSYILAMAGDNTAGDQWTVSTGGYQALEFSFH